MALFRGLLLSLALASGVWTTPVERGASACAQVSASWAAQAAATATPTVSAELAYDCLTSAPFNKSAALALIDSIRPYFLWQSTTQYLKNPPAEYVAKIQAGVDVWGGLDQIEHNAKAGVYKQEFQVGRLISK
jgi:hypothetical protein